MIVLINNIQLDIPKQEVSLHFSNMRFTDFFTDAYSTTLEIPKTVTNITLLNLWGMNDRRAQLYGTLKECEVVVLGMTFAGRIEVCKVMEDTAEVTVYFGGLTDANIKVPINELVHDDGDTIIDWVTAQMETENDGHSGVHVTLFNDGKGGGSFTQPNIALPSLMDKVAGLLTVMLPAFENTQRLVATQRLVCPWVPEQVSFWRMDTNAPAGLIIRAGQHVCVDVDTNVLTFTRACSVHVFARLRTVTWGTVTSVTVHRTSGAFTADLFSAYLPASAGGMVDGSATITVAAGDKITATCSGSAVADMGLVLEISDYEVVDADKEVPLNIDLSTSADYTIPSWMPSGHSLVWFGMIHNLAPISVADILISLAWKEGEMLTNEGGRLSYVSEQRALDIDAEIQAYVPYLDALGRVSKAVTADDVTQAQVTFANELLEREKVVHKSAFISVEGTDVLTVPLYEQADGAYKWIGSNNAVYADMIIRFAQGVLMPSREMTMLGLETLSRVMLIEGVTDSNLINVDYVYIRGHKYMVVEFDMDEESGLTNFKALII